jgi:RNA-binding protein 15
MNRTARYHSNRDVDPDVDDYERAAKRRKEDRVIAGSSSSGQLIDPQFRTLCLSQFNQRIPDEEITVGIYRAFKKFGEFTVKIAFSSGRRLAYVTFRYAEDAYAAKQTLKDRLNLFDDMVRIDVVYSTKPSRGRSASPPGSVPVSRDGYRRPSPHSARPLGKEGNGAYDGPRDSGIYYEKGPTKDAKYSHGSHQHVPPEDDESATRTLFVGNLDYDITADELQRVFERYGVVEDVDVKRAAAGSGAYAFIRFFNLDMAFNAKVEMSGHTIGHHQCRIGYGKPTPSNCVWVGGIGPWLRPDILDHVFRRYGAVQRIEWPPGQNYAYVVYTNSEEARSAVATLRGAPLGGPDRRIRVDFADVGQVNSPVNQQRNGREQNRDLELQGGATLSSRPWPPPERSDYDAEVDRKLHTERRHSERSLTQTDIPPKNSRRRSPSPNCRSAERNPENDELGGELDVSTVAEMANKLPIVWSGNLMLKNSAFATRLHLVRGNARLVDVLMRDPSSTERTSLKITQRLRLDESKLGEVRRRITQAGPGECSVLLALPSLDTGGIVPPDAQHRPLKNLVTYLRQKDAAGVIVLPPAPAIGASGSDKSRRDTGLLHAFPPCDFAREHLLVRAPQLSSQICEDYLMILVVRTSA